MTTLGLQVYVNGQRHEYKQQRLTWAGLTRARVYQSAQVEMVVTCNADVYYPLQCHVELEVAWVTTLLLGCLVCMLMRSIWVTTHELKRLQQEAEQVSGSFKVPAPHHVAVYMVPPPSNCT